MLAKILNTSTGRCWSSDTYNPYPGVFEGVPSSNNYQGGFGSQLMAKVRQSFLDIVLLYDMDSASFCYFEPYFPPEGGMCFRILNTVDFKTGILTSTV